jgi:hypothetical protein
MIKDGGTWNGYFTTRIYLKRFYQVYSRLTRDFSSLIYSLANHVFINEIDHRVYESLN